MSRRTASAANGRTLVGGIGVSHPERVIYTEPDLTKLDIARYMEAIAPWIMPHARNRPLSLFRCPAGIKGPCFFHKHMEVPPAHGVKEVPIEESKGVRTYPAVMAPEGFVYLVQMNALEMHGWGSLADRLEAPDRLVFDLDPGEGVSWDDLTAAATLIRNLLACGGLMSFPKTTGGKGVHVVAPLQRRAPWESVKAYAKAVAERVEAFAPDAYLTSMTKSERKGRIFIDSLRNQRGATSVLPYSVRARPGATVSMPVSWDELGDVRPAQFTVLTAAEHARTRKRDPWKEMTSLKQSLTATVVKRTLS